MGLGGCYAIMCYEMKWKILGMDDMYNRSYSAPGKRGSRQSLCMLEFMYSNLDEQNI